jgi:hypothetical protein
LEEWTSYGEKANNRQKSREDNSADLTTTLIHTPFVLGFHILSPTVALPKAVET